jgi:hypothetical protein
MAVPPTVTKERIVKEALQRAGFAEPDAEQMERGKDVWLHEVMNDILVRARGFADGLLKSLHTTSTAITIDNQRRYSVPCDYDEELNLVLLEGTHTDTAQDGDNTTVTLASDEDVTQADAEGHYVLMLAGESKGQYRQITGYNATTKVATVEDAWDSGDVPTSGDTYLIVDTETNLEEDFMDPFDTQANVTAVARPQRFSTFNYEFYLDPTPDDTYGLRLRYYANPAKIDLDDVKWSTILRDWQRVLTLGVQMLAEQNNDDDRAEETESKYEKALVGTIARENPFGDEPVKFVMEGCR